MVEFYSGISPSRRARIVDLMPIRAAEYRVERALRSEFECRHGPESIRVCRYADLPPAFRVGGTRRLGLAGVLNGVTAD
jgi:hypothetical protein